MTDAELAGPARAVRPGDNAPCFRGSTDGSTGDVDQLLESLSRLSSMSSDPDVSDAVRIDRIAALERLQAAAFAAQAAEIARFAVSQLAEQRRAGVPARRLGIGTAGGRRAARADSGVDEPEAS
jgi:hypothetical protein